MDQAISSGQQIFKPCLFSIVLTNKPASFKSSNDPVSSHTIPLPKNLAKSDFVANVVPAIDTYISIINGGTYDDLESWNTED